MARNDRVFREKRLEAARGYLILEMPDSAIRELDAIKDPEKCRFELNKLWGEALQQKTDHENALDAYGRAWDEDPTDLSVVLGMAWCYKRTNQLPKAIAVMEEAYRLHSEVSIVLYNLACYLALADEKEQSLSWLGRALRMDPTLSKLIRDESDFDLLRDDPGFQLITRIVSDKTDSP